MQAIVTVQRAVGRGDAKGLCVRVAERVARDRGFDAMTELTIVAGRHNAIDYLVRDVHGTESVLARCPIVRKARR
jgi:hypothetical protein